MGIFGRLFSKEYKNGVGVGVKLRQVALEITPEQIEIISQPAKPFAAFMETGMPGACVTLSIIADGSTSLYFSNGGGMIGGGEYEAVRKESYAFLELASSFVHYLQPTIDLSLPPLGVTRFVLKTPEGFYAGQAAEDELVSQSSPLSPLFFQGQSVITKFREAAQARKETAKD